MGHYHYSERAQARDADGQLRLFMYSRKIANESGGKPASPGSLHVQLKFALIHSRDRRALRQSLIGF